MKRQLCTILAADMVGYSRLMEVDEIGILERQNSYLETVIRPRLDARGGTLVKLMGDGILASFDSVVDAVAFAVEVQRQIGESEASQPQDKRICYRVGINLGDVIEENGDLFGDAVNIAARLEELADPGGICISGTSYDHLKSQVDVDYESLGMVQVKNLSHPVRAYRVLLSGHGQTRLTKSRKYLKAIVAVLAIAGMVAAGVVFVERGRQSEGIVTGSAEDPQSSAFDMVIQDRPSIAVLPFDNMGGSEDGDYFSDGMTEDLITDLSQVSGLFVLARNTTFAYKGRSVNVSQVGRELNVAYVLEGSVRRFGDKVRINAQLIDTSTGGHVWADRYDGAMTDVFALQDWVVQQIVSALAVELDAEEEQRLSRTQQVNPEAYDLVLRGLESMRRFSAPTNLAARRFFEAALTVDPSFARAKADLALTYAMDAEQHWSVDPRASAERGLALAEAARDLDPKVAQTHFVLTVVYRTLGRIEDSIRAGERALELDPNYADAYATLASSLNYAGRTDEALDAIHEAIKLNPIVAFFYVWIEGQTYYVRGEFEKAAGYFERVISSNPAFTAGHRMLAATYVELGRLDDAEWAAQEVLATAPDYSVDTDAQVINFTDPELKARIISNLRQAGLP